MEQKFPSDGKPAAKPKLFRRNPGKEIVNINQKKEADNKVKCDNLSYEVKEEIKVDNDKHNKSELVGHDVVIDDANIYSHTKKRQKDDEEKKDLGNKIDSLQPNIPENKPSKAPQAIPEIPGLSFIIGIKADDETSSKKLLYHCVICHEEDDTITFLGSAMKKHSHSRTHLLSVMRAECHVLYEKFVDDHQKPATELLKELMEYESKLQTQKIIIVRRKNYRRHKEKVILKIRELLKKANLITAKPKFQESKNAGKIYIGRIALKTNQRTVQEYFEQFGKVNNLDIKRNKGIPFNYGFIVFSHATMVDEVLKHAPHCIDGQILIVERYGVKSEVHRVVGQCHSDFNKEEILSGENPLHTIYVGPLDCRITIECVKCYLETFGEIVTAHFNKSRNLDSFDKHFGFVTFNNPITVNKVLQHGSHQINGIPIRMVRFMARNQLNQEKSGRAIKEHNDTKSDSIIQVRYDLNLTPHQGELYQKLEEHEDNKLSFSSSVENIKECFQLNLQEIGELQHGRSHRNIVIVTDERDNLDVTMTGFDLRVTVMRIPGLKFANAFSAIRKHSSFGQGSIFVYSGGTHDLVHSIPLQDCVESHCSSMKTMLTLSPCVRDSHCLIAMALELNMKILSSTPNDMILFAGILPIIVNKFNMTSLRGRNCALHHPVMPIPVLNVDDYMLAVDCYNEFIKFHSQTLGYPIWNLTTPCFSDNNQNVLNKLLPDGYNISPEEEFKRANLAKNICVELLRGSSSNFVAQMDMSQEPLNKLMSSRNTPSLHKDNNTHEGLLKDFNCYDLHLKRDGSRGEQLEQLSSQKGLLNDPGRQKIPLLRLPSQKEPLLRLPSQKEPLLRFHSLNEPMKRISFFSQEEGQSKRDSGKDGLLEEPNMQQGLLKGVTRQEGCSSQGGYLERHSSQKNPSNESNSLKGLLEEPKSQRGPLIRCNIQKVPMKGLNNQEGLIEGLSSQKGLLNEPCSKKESNIQKGPMKGLNSQVGLMEGLNSQKVLLNEPCRKKERNIQEVSLKGNCQKGLLEGLNRQGGLFSGLMRKEELSNQEGLLEGLNRQGELLKGFTSQEGRLEFAKVPKWQKEPIKMKKEPPDDLKKPKIKSEIDTLQTKMPSTMQEKERGTDEVFGRIKSLYENEVKEILSVTKEEPIENKLININKDPRIARQKDVDISRPEEFADIKGQEQYHLPLDMEQQATCDNELLEKVKSLYNNNMAKIIKMRQNRSPNKICLVTDEREHFEASLAGLDERIDFLKVPEMKFGTVWSSLKSHASYGKGTNFVFCGGNHDLIYSILLPDCLKFKCQSPQKVMTFRPCIKDTHYLIKKSLQLHMNVLLDTRSDTVSFCGLIPVSLNQYNFHTISKRPCSSNHNVKEIPAVNAMSVCNYNDVVDWFNAFTKYHSKMLQYPPWNLEKRHFDKNGKGDTLSANLFDYSEKEEFGRIEQVKVLCKELLRKSSSSEPPIAKKTFIPSTQTADTSTPQTTSEIVKKMGQLQSANIALKSPAKPLAKSIVGSSPNFGEKKGLKASDKKLESVMTKSLKASPASVDAEPINVTIADIKQQPARNEARKVESQIAAVKSKYSKKQLEKVSDRYHNSVQKIVEMHKGRTQNSIVLVTDERDNFDVCFVGFSDRVEVLKIPGMQFTNVFDILKGHRSFGKGTIFIFSGGTHDVLNPSALQDCLVHRCTRPQAVLTLPPTNSGPHFLIEMVLKLNMEILGATKNDVALFSGLLPLLINKYNNFYLNSRPCFLDHPAWQLPIISSTVDNNYKCLLNWYNDFTKLHAQSLGYEPWDLEAVHIDKVTEVLLANGYNLTPNEEWERNKQAKSLCDGLLLKLIEVESTVDSTTAPPGTAALTTAQLTKSPLKSLPENKVLIPNETINKIIDIPTGAVRTRIDEEIDEVITFSKNILNAIDDDDEVPSVAFENVFFIGKRDVISPLFGCNIKSKMIYHELTSFEDNDLMTLLGKIGDFPEKSVCCLAFDLSIITKKLIVSPTCLEQSCQQPLFVTALKTSPGANSVQAMKEVNQYIYEHLRSISKFVTKLSQLCIPIIILPLAPERIYCDEGVPEKHRLSHEFANLGSCVVANGSKDLWTEASLALIHCWNNLMETQNEIYDPSKCIVNYIQNNPSTFIILDDLDDYISHWKAPRFWKAFMELYLSSVTQKRQIKTEDADLLDKTCDGVVISKVSPSIPFDFFDELFHSIDQDVQIVRERNQFTLKGMSLRRAFLLSKLNHFRLGDMILLISIVNKPENVSLEMNLMENLYISCIFERVYRKWKGRLIANLTDIINQEPNVASYKTELCEKGSRCSELKRCLRYHSQRDKRRNPFLHKYSNTMCTMVKNSEGVCRQSAQCRNAHNVYEAKFHPSTYQNRTCPSGTSSEACNSLKHCEFAHKDSPEMFFTAEWNDLVAVGANQALRFFSGAIRGIPKVQGLSRLNMRVLFISPSSEFLDVALRATNDLIKALGLSTCMLSKDTDDLGSSQILLGAPSSFLNLDTRVFIQMRGAIIIDDIQRILENEHLRNDLSKMLNLITASSYNVVLNKVFISVGFNSKLASDISELVGLQPKQLHVLPELDLALSDVQRTSPKCNISQKSLDSKSRPKSRSFSKSRRSKSENKDQVSSGKRSNSRSRTRSRGKRSISRSRSRSRGKRSFSRSRSRSRGKRSISISRSRSRGKRSISRSRSRSRGKRSISRSRSSSRTRSLKRSKRSRSRSMRRSKRSGSRSRFHRHSQYYRRTRSITRIRSRSRSVKRIRRSRSNSRSRRKSLTGTSEKNSSSGSAHQRQSSLPSGSQDAGLLKSGSRSPAKISKSEAPSHALKLGTSDNASIEKELPCPSMEVQNNLRKRIGAKQFEEYLLTLETLRHDFAEEYLVYRDMPELYSEYAHHFDIFSALFAAQRGDCDKKRKESLWRVFWKSKYEDIRLDDWRTKLSHLTEEFEKRVARCAASSPEIDSSLIFEKAFNLLEGLCDEKIFYLAPGLRSLIDMCRERGTSTKEAYKLVTEADNVALLNIAFEKFKILSLSSVPKDSRRMYELAVEWIPKLLAEAEKGHSHKIREEGSTIDLESIARFSLGKAPEVTLNLIKTALAYEGTSTPPIEVVNELFLKVCKIHFTLSMGE